MSRAAASSTIFKAPDVLEARVEVVGAEIGNVDFRNTRFKEAVSFAGSAFSGLAWFDGAIFEKEVDFGGAVFDNDLRLDRALFRERASFADAEFRGVVCFDNAVFNGAAVFKAINANASFSAVRASFASLDLRQAKLWGGLCASGTTCSALQARGALAFGRVTVDRASPLSVFASAE